MTLAERRLAELERISRERELTVEEQLEAMRRARETRYNVKRRHWYATDPAFREKAKGRSPAERARLREARA